MSILKLNLPANGNKKSRQYDLNIVLSGAGDLSLINSSTFILDGHRVLHSGRSEVYRARLYSADPSRAVEVVCKIAEGSALPLLEEEARIYTTVLKSVWRRVVPHFYCYSTGVSPYTNKPIACMVIRYAEKRLPGDDWFKTSPQNRFRAFSALIKLHRLGIWHYNFAPSNVVIDEDGKLLIIDFNMALANHDCLVADRKYHLFEYTPSRCDLKCGEVYEASKAMDIWTPAMCLFKESPIPMIPLPSPDEVVAMLRKRQPAFPLEKAKKDAKVFVHDYCQYYLQRRADFAKERAEARKKMKAKERAEAEMKPEGLPGAVPDPEPAKVAKAACTSLCSN